MAKNGNSTFTAAARRLGGQKATQMRSGWPEWKKGTIEDNLTAAGRRFDEPGMEVKFKPRPKLGW